MADDMEAIENLFDAYVLKPAFKKDIMEILVKFLPDNVIAEEVVQPVEEKAVINSGCLEILPEVVEKLDGEFMKEWEQIKNDLIIFDIEDFH